MPLFLTFVSKPGENENTFYTIFLLQLVVDEEVECRWDPAECGWDLAEPVDEI